MQRVTLQELETLVSNPEINLASLEKYFRTIPNQHRPYTPAIEIDEEFVSLEGSGIDNSRSERGTQMLINILNRSFAARRQRLYRSRIEQGWSGLRLVAEGDSWLQFPHPMTGRDDIVDYLMNDPSLLIYCMSAAGDTLNNMFHHIDQVKAAIRKEDAQALIFSGGGNDIAGPQIARFLHEHQYGAQPSELLDDNFNSFLNDLKQRYMSVFGDILEEFDHLQIFTHGYDYARPQPGGSWLGPRFAAKNIPQAHWSTIVKIMIDRFYDTLGRIAAANGFQGRFHVVDCRNSLGGPASWRDELHGTPKAMSVPAHRFLKKISEVHGLEPTSFHNVRSGNEKWQVRYCRIQKVRSRNGRTTLKTRPSDTRPRDFRLILTTDLRRLMDSFDRIYDLHLEHLGDSRYAKFLVDKERGKLEIEHATNNSYEYTYEGQFGLYVHPELKDEVRQHLPGG